MRFYDEPLNDARQDCDNRPKPARPDISELDGPPTEFLADRDYEIEYMGLSKERQDFLRDKVLVAKMRRDNQLKLKEVLLQRREKNAHNRKKHKRKRDEEDSESLRPISPNGDSDKENLDPQSPTEKGVNSEEMANRDTTSNELREQMEVMEDPEFLGLSKTPRQLSSKEKKENWYFNRSVESSAKIPELQFEMFMWFRPVQGDGSCLFSAVVLSLHYETNQEGLKSKILTNKAILLRHEALQTVMDNFEILDGIDAFGSSSVQEEERGKFLEKAIVLLGKFRDNSSMWFLSRQDTSHRILESMLVDFCSFHLKRRILTWDRKAENIIVSHGFANRLNHDVSEAPLSVEYNYVSEHFSGIQFKSEYSHLPLLMNNVIDGDVQHLPKQLMDEILFNCFLGVKEAQEIEDRVGVVGPSDLL